MTAPGAPVQSSKVFAFFGADIGTERINILRHVASKGYTLLALDTPAIGIASEAKLPYTLMDDWLDSAGRFAARKNAAECEKGWFQSARESFTAEGICWPEFDHHAMHWFWLDATHALAMAEAFMSRGVRELRFLTSPLQRPAVSYSPSDICFSLWKARIPSIAKSYGTTQRRTLRQLIPRRLRPALRQILYLLRGKYPEKHIRAFPPAAEFKGKVVLALNEGEAYRFTHIAHQLGREFAAVILEPEPATAASISAKWAVPVAAGPPPDVVPGLGKRFLRGLRVLRKAAAGQPWQEPLEMLPFHFEYYCTQRWPQLAASLGFWTDSWKSVSPEAVIISSLMDGESQLPAQAARCLGIPAFSVPHGAGPGIPRYFVPIESVLYSSRIQMRAIQRTGVSPDQLIACRDITVENEYPVKPSPNAGGDKTWRVLALTESAGIAGCLAYSVSPSAQISAFRALNQVPADIEAHIGLRLKAHPIFSDRELFAAAGTGILAKLMPLNSELRSALRETDIVIAVNCASSSLVHTFREGKPVIFFWTDELIGKVEPNTNAELFLPGGTLVRSGEELWDLIRRFFTSPAFAEEMRLKSQQFSREYLDDTGYPTISEILSRYIRGNEKPVTVYSHNR